MSGRLRGDSGMVAVALGGASMISMRGRFARATLGRALSVRVGARVPKRVQIYRPTAATPRRSEVCVQIVGSRHA